jgi:transposase
MAGRFAGVSDWEWRLCEDILPPAPPQRRRGMPHAPFRQLLHTWLYVWITGCRWCEVPRGPHWASKSATHRWLPRGQAEGTLAAMPARILGMTEARGLIQGRMAPSMALLPPGKGGGEGGAYGGQGTGRLLHSLTEGRGRPLANRGTPAKGEERAPGLPWLDAVTVHPGKRGRRRNGLKVSATEKGYEAPALRQRGSRAQSPKRVWKTRKPRGRPSKKAVPRFQAERPCAWFQKKYRRLVVRWERLAACLETFLALATVHIGVSIGS